MAKKLASVNLNYCAQKLKKLFAQNCLPHAIMIIGNVQHGYIISIEFAKYLFCDSKTHDKCDCKGCNLFSANNHPDYFLVDLGVDQEIKVDLIREINKFTLSTTYLANKKIVLINNFHNLNKQAANAILKTLEEPSLHTDVLFLLTTDNPSILPATILSRVFQYNIIIYQQSKETREQIIQSGMIDDQLELLQDLYDIWIQESPNSLKLIEKWQSCPKSQLINYLWFIITNLIKTNLDIKEDIRVGHIANSSNDFIQNNQLTAIKQKISLHTQWELLDSLNYINKLFILGYQINWRLFLYNFIMSKFIKRNIYGRAARS
jgi:DNA polymerase III, delta subunit